MPEPPFPTQLKDLQLLAGRPGEENRGQSPISAKGSGLRSEPAVEIGL
jgi:hypothetical protein